MYVWVEGVGYGEIGCVLPVTSNDGELIDANTNREV